MAPTRTISAARRYIEGLPEPWAAVLVLAALLLADGTAQGYEDGAPPGHTGGFGEPDCSACHADSDPNPPKGSLRIEGLPDRIVADAEYELLVLLEHPGLRRGGFQLSVRSPDGNPAGQLVSLSNRTRLVKESGQVYLQHTREGLQPEDDGTGRWQLRWIADGVSGPVHLHIAANAANDDISALGDYIFTLERVVSPFCALIGSSRKR